MAEAIESRLAEEASVRRSPLEAAHARACALVKERDGCLVPAHYGDAGAEYDAVRGGAGAGVFDLSSRGRARVSGGEAVQFLNGMLTNDVARLADGAWMHAAFPNAQGRLLASARVFRRGDAFLFDTEAATRERVLKTLERFTLAGDFRVRDLTDETATLSVQGARARETVSAALGSEAADTARGRTSSVRFQKGEVTVARATHTKVCYTGQEIIARIHWRGNVAKKLAGLVFDREAEPPTDARIKSCVEDREVGRIPSTVFSPRLRRQIALGLVKYDHLAHGTEVRIFNGDSELCAAHVAELPLVRGSWYADDEGAGACVESGV